MATHVSPNFKQAIVLNIKINIRYRNLVYVDFSFISYEPYVKTWCRTFYNFIIRILFNINKIEMSMSKIFIFGTKSLSTQAQYFYASKVIKANCS